MIHTELENSTLDDLLRVDGKAELIGGRIVCFMPTGHLPSVLAFTIARLLHVYKKLHGGVAHADGVAYAVPRLRSGRESFSPDASYYNGPLPVNRMRFIDGAPTFAAEVRSENDYGLQAELELANKRADYFEAGTLAVWDVDPVNQRVHCFRIAAPLEKETFCKGRVINLPNATF